MLFFYQSGQGHAGDRANQLNRLAVVDVTVSHSELFSFWLFVIHWKHTNAEEERRKKSELRWTTHEPQHFLNTQTHIQSASHFLCLRWISCVITITPRGLRLQQTERNAETKWQAVKPHSSLYSCWASARCEAFLKFVCILMFVLVCEAYTGGCKRRPTAGSWRESCHPPRVDSACWLFGTEAGWTVPPWSLMQCTLWTNMNKDTHTHVT